MEKQAGRAAASPTAKSVLVSGASFAGLATAHALNQLGYDVTIVEIAKGVKKGGTPVNIGGEAKDVLKRMGVLGQVQANRLKMEGVEFKNSDDVTEGAMRHEPDVARADDDLEIERDTLLDIVFTSVKDDVELVFNNSIAALDETENEINVSFQDGTKRTFALVFGCDGNHSLVRKLQFGDEAEYAHFLGQYFSITIVDKLLIRENTTQIYNVPGKAVMLNAYNNKTDIILCFSSEKEISYDYRDEAQQRKIISEQFAGQGWRTQELLGEVGRSKTFYFDKVNQIKMPSWVKGRVALVGDAAYCASPAAGMGGSLAIIGAGALADAFEKNHGNFKLAFQDYNKSFRPFIEGVQAHALKTLDALIPKTDEAIRKRNAQTNPW
ncbi:MAG: FAD-dependent monooxygenase [Beijerinckiaceae bacterium]|nr:FAD-dependent monooxygenase [Beijerinckiaceae bacterium]